MAQPIFNADAMEEIRKTVRESQRGIRSTGSHQGRWHKKGGGGGSGAKIIDFQIISSDPSIREALVQIEQRTVEGTVYGSTLGDTVVYVYDSKGCFLNEPNVDLTGRQGTAGLYLVDDAAIALHFATDYTPPTWYWNVINLCCPQTVCS
jgi:hypothetical protein